MSESASGEPSLGIATHSVANLHALGAQVVFPVRHICRADGVGNQQHAVLTLGARQQTDGCRVNMYTVGDDFSKNSVVGKNGAENSEEWAVNADNSLIDDGTVVADPSDPEIGRPLQIAVRV